MELRQHFRYNCNGSADLTDGETGRVWGHVTDISLGGFYVSTFGPLTVETEVRFKLDVEGREIGGIGMVATSHPGVGMAVLFQELPAPSKQALDELLNELETAKKDETNIGLQL